MLLQVWALLLEGARELPNGDVQPPPKAVGWNNGLGGNSFDSLQERLEFYQSDFARLDAE